MIIGTLVNDGYYQQRAYKVEVVSQTDRYYFIRGIEAVTKIYFNKPYRKQLLKRGTILRVEKYRIDDIKEVEL